MVGVRRQHERPVEKWACPPPTCDGALAGVSCWQRSDSVRGVGDLVASILDEDGVSAGHVWHVGHQVGPIVVVPDVGLFGLSLWVLWGWVWEWVQVLKRGNQSAEEGFRSRSTHRDLHCQQSLAGILGVDGELDRQRGGNPGGVEARPAGTHLTGVVGGEDLHLVGAERGGVASAPAPKGRPATRVAPTCAGSPRQHTER